MGYGPAWRNPVLVVGIALIVFPFLVTNKTLAIQILIWGLFALSYNVLLGSAGLLSFGHATFFGIGAYASGLIMKHLWPSLWAGIAAAMVSAAAVAFVIGLLAVGKRGVTFTMLTVAFCQMIFFIFFSPLAWLTGGDDGLRGVPTPPLKVPGLFEMSIVSVRYPYNFYFFALVLVMISIYMLWRLDLSPFGDALRAIRESEERARALGYNTRALQLQAFVISGTIAGLAGALNTLYLAFVPVNSLSFDTSGIVVMMTVLGGKGTFVGPFLGATVYWVMANYLSLVTEYWPFVVGIVFMLTVLFFPSGLAGLLTSVTRRVRVAEPSISTASAARVEMPKGES